MTDCIQHLLITGICITPDHIEIVPYLQLRGTQVRLAASTTAVSLLANEFDVRSVLHEQVSLAAVNQMYVIHEAMNGC